MAGQILFIRLTGARNYMSGKRLQSWAMHRVNNDPQVVLKVPWQLHMQYVVSIMSTKYHLCRAAHQNHQLLS